MALNSVKRVALDVCSYWAWLDLQDWLSPVVVLPCSCKAYNPLPHLFSRQSILLPLPNLLPPTLLRFLFLLLLLRLLAPSRRISLSLQLRPLRLLAPHLHLHLRLPLLPNRHRHLAPRRRLPPHRRRGLHRRLHRFLLFQQGKPLSLL